MNSPLKPSKPSLTSNAAMPNADSWLEAIDHIQITSLPQTVVEMVYFYGTILGLQALPKPEGLKAKGGAWYELSTMQLHIGLEQDVRNDASRRHSCFQVKALQSFRNHLETQGVPIIADTQPLPDCDRFYLRDPGGNRIEIISRADKWLD